VTPAMTTGDPDTIADGPAASPDEVLLMAYRSHGDRAALDRLVERHSDQAYRLASRLAGNASDADDVMQEAVLALMSSANQYRPTATGSVRSWYLAIVANAYRRRARAARRRSHREQDGPAPGRGTPDPASGQWDEEVRLAVDALPEHERLPILLRHGDEPAISDIAAALGRKEKTVRSQIDRGLERLRAMLSARSGLRSQAGIITAVATACAPTRSPSPHLLAALQHGILTSILPAAATGIGMMPLLLLAGILCTGLGIAVSLHGHGRQGPVMVPVAVPIPMPAQSTLIQNGSGGASGPNQHLPAVVAAIRDNPQGQQDLVMLTVGKDSHLMDGTEFIVYRGTHYIVKLRAERVMQDTIACRIMPGSWNVGNLPLVLGDLAVNRL